MFCIFVPFLFVWIVSADPGKKPNSESLLEGNHLQTVKTLTKAANPYGKLGYLVSNLGEEFCTVTPVTPFVVFTLRCCVNKSQYKGAHLMIEETKNYVKNKLHSGGEKVNDDVDLAAIKVRDKIKNVKFSLPENFQNQDYNINVGDELTMVELCNYQYCITDFKITGVKHTDEARLSKVYIIENSGCHSFTIKNYGSPLVINNSKVVLAFATNIRNPDMDLKKPPISEIFITSVYDHRFFISNALEKFEGSPVKDKIVPLSDYQVSIERRLRGMSRRT